MMADAASGARVTATQRPATIGNTLLSNLRNSQDVIVVVEGTARIAALIISALSNHLINVPTVKRGGKMTTRANHTRDHNAMTASVGPWSIDQII